MSFENGNKAGIEAKKNPDKLENREEVDFQKAKKLSIDIHNNAEKISPESNKNWELTKIKDYFDAQVSLVDTEFRTSSISKKEKDNKMKELVQWYIGEINTTIWTQERKDSSQNEEFKKNKEQENKSYTELLDDFNEKLKKDLSETKKTEEAKVREEDKREVTKSLEISFGLWWIWISFWDKNNASYEKVKPEYREALKWAMWDV